ncbi:glycerophosphoryl diester phosphodiesterase family protein, partial [Vibrio parahaemolyticus V-223/04]
TITWIASRM